MSYPHNKRFKAQTTEMQNSYYGQQGGYHQPRAPMLHREGGAAPAAAGDLYHKQPQNNRPSNILLYTIMNQKYVISIEAIHKISVRFGHVVRIVMIRKRGTQALVEFDDVEAAKRAMDGLQNQDIYSGCCTLKIDYNNKSDKLNVKRCDENSWDFTVQPLINPALLQTPPREPLIQTAHDPSPYHPQHHGYQPRGGHQGGGGHHAQYGAGQGQVYSDRRFDTRTPVAICYGLTDTINCQHIFNLFCLYGNVLKVKFMKSKEGCCMVEFNHPDAVTKACKLTGIELQGSQMTIRPSKSLFVGEPKGESFVLADGSPGFEDFSRNKFNRFSNPEKAAKNRPQEPRSTLHFFNSPPDITEDSIRDLIDKESPAGCEILKVLMFPRKEMSKSCSGLIQFETSGQAITVMAFVNHLTMDSEESEYPYHIKFCFATQDIDG